MAATDKPYRNQRTLDVVFGVSCGLMLLTTLWMFWQDYFRDFKAVQRKFRDVEAAVAERDMVERLPSAGEVAQRRDKAKEAREALEAKKKELRPVERDLLAQREQADDKYREVKADYDAYVSYLNIARDEVGKVPTGSDKAKSLQADADKWAKKVNDKDAELQKAKAAFDAADQKYRQEVRQHLEPLEKAVADAEDDLKKLTGTFDRYAKLAAQKAWGSGDTFRNLPIIDGFAAPAKINQLWLPDLTIDYGGFKDVPRYDRCTTCHLGIDRANYDKESLAKLTDKAEAERLNGKLREAQKILQRRQAAGEKLGFDPDDLPGERSGSLPLVTMLLLASALIAALSLGILEKSWRLGIRVLTAGLALTLLTGAAMAIFMPRVPQVKHVPLSESEVNMYCAHPRMDLFVGSNSPHPMEKFGCTTCHSGQGSATDFNNASHSPSDAGQEKKWADKHKWASNHYWDFPMLAGRFVESSCLKCHHQVTDLIRDGVKEEAPKLLKGYHLVKEMGCFGCHEIQGVKNGRWVGPDLRLEPAPALDQLSAADQERAKSDPASPPGTMRKVGPSLRRLVEKSPEKWTRQWIMSPRGFREDTRMPHFYNLSTNSEDKLPADQKSHPATEVHAIAHYLFHESRGHLAAKDTYRTALLSGPRNLHELQKKLGDSGLDDRDLKELFDVSRRFADLALLSSPRQQATINSDATKQRQLQERLRELHKSKAEQQAKNLSTAALDASILAAAQELKGVTDSLVQAAVPVPLSKGLTDGAGNAVKLPADNAGNATRGRELFTEKGCLACHSHDGTTKDGGPKVTSDANFGPDLSRIKAKVQDRAWLVQWVLNPNIYHPRTRMPITHLSVAQANDIATWLLSQDAGDWEKNAPDPTAPTREELKKLADVYLARVGWVRDNERDTFLDKGIPSARLQGLPRDADERLLEGGITDDKLKLYIGKKAIAKQGCYACHDIPGFETAKPIGTGLNDWGRKDNERLAFEDADAFVKAHFNIVQKRGSNTADLEAAEKRLAAIKAMDEGERKRLSRELADLEAKVERLRKAKEVTERVVELRKKKLEKGLSSAEEKELKDKAGQQFFESAGGKRPFEEIFYHAIEHHQREGFLQLKLLEPRAFDYGRRVKWDDRLRMPQFQFARTRQKAGESAEAYAARKEREEAEAREAVMTFVLGLVGEPVPLKYVNQPKGDRAAEVAGRQVLDKYNCASCHQIAPGQYDFSTNPKALADLVEVHNKRTRDDYSFLHHNAWFGAGQTVPNRLTATGILYREEKAALLADDKEGIDPVRLSDALRFTGPDGIAREIPAGESILLAEGSYTARPVFGGTWADLMVPYVARKRNYDAKQLAEPRSHLPPTLIRLGEKIRPDWLYGFLLNPTPIRPYDSDPSKSYMLLRMPKFNMSPDEARALVNYFTATARTSNPGAGVTAPFVDVPQKDAEYWQRQSTEYATYARGLVGRLEKLKARPAELKKEIAQLQKDLADKGKEKQHAKLKEQLAAKQRELQQLAELEKNQAKLDENIAKIKQALGQADKDKGARDDTLYQRLAVRALTDTNGCFQCHDIGSHQKKGEVQKGPNLGLAAQRIRPEYAEKWIHAPKRLFPYPPVMTALFPAAEPWGWSLQQLFPGEPLRQSTAVRDLLMDGERLERMLKLVPPPTTAPPEKDKDKKK